MLPDSHNRGADAIGTTRHCGEPSPGKPGTLPLPAEIGWRRSVATIRMQLQLFGQVFVQVLLKVFAVICESA
jgi:hypothetical protein